MKSSTNEIKNSLEGLDSRFELAEESVSKFKERSIEIIKSKEQKEKIMRKNKQTPETCGIPSKTPKYT